MKYCLKCGSELKGAKSFCMACGANQHKVRKESDSQKIVLPKEKKDPTRMGTCYKCGDDTEKECFFCKKHICRYHHIRMQPNLNPFGNMQELKNLGESHKIHEDWRGFIVFGCPRCAGMKERKQLTDDELEDMNINEHCSRYRLD